MITSPRSIAFFTPIKTDMAAVNQVIRTHLYSEVALVNQISEYIISAGGKRIRPQLLLLFANAYGYTGTHHHLLAAIIEFIHTATLLHDDVVDESTLRRGRQTANALFGNAASVLVGDFLYSRAFQMMVLINHPYVMKVLSDATNVIAEGEVLQLLNIKNPDITQARYLEVIRSKTAKLFEAATQLGAFIAGAEESHINAAAEYGRCLGTAFQLIDDVLDYSGKAEDIGKNLGDDLREGKATLPLIFLMEHGTPTEQALVRNCISQGDAQHFDEIVQAITERGALEYTKKQAQAAIDQAILALQTLPDSPFKDALFALAEFEIHRQS